MILIPVYRISLLIVTMYNKIWVSVTYLIKISLINPLTLSRRRTLSYRNQSIDLLRKSMDWFLYDNGLRHERVKRQYHIMVKHALKQFVRKLPTNCLSVSDYFVWLSLKWLTKEKLIFNETFVSYFCWYCKIKYSWSVLQSPNRKIKYPQNEFFPIAKLSTHKI